MKKYYIGLAATYHDPALAIVDDPGEVIFAEATERYRQYKRAFNCTPDNRPTIIKVIKEHCDPDAEFVVAKTWSRLLHFKTGNLFRLGLLNHRRLVKTSGKMTKYLARMYQIFCNANLQFSVLNLTGATFIKTLRDDFNNNKIRYLYHPHHRTHAATTCYTSGFDEAACMIIDGFGEDGAMACYQYKNGTIKELRSQRGAESLGLVYGTVTSYCGFDPEKGEEWKVMGLAPYGKLIPSLYERFKEVLTVKGVELKYKSKKHLLQLLDYMEQYRPPAGASSWEAADLAFTAQEVFGDVLTEMLNNFYQMGVSDNLVLGGGCGLNSAYIGQIIERTPFKQVYLPCAPGDDGNAIGAALLAYYQDNPGEQRKPRFQTPYLGSEMSELTLKNLQRFGNLSKTRHLPGTVHEAAAALLAEGKLMGWVQGRAEFGPRALGNRSILADPRHPDMKNKINDRVKFREEFRPFAPSILHEYGDEYFENYQETPYMERTLCFKEAVRDKVPAVVHANSTGRLQTVKEEWNPAYYRLIKEFHRLTGVPIVLNTSFNVMGKPIIHSVEDAVSVFFTSGLDVLVIGDYLIEK